MTTPPKTREEWYDRLLHLSPEYSEDVPRAWAEILDSIMSLQAEVENRGKCLDMATESLMVIESMYRDDFGDPGVEASKCLKEIEKARQPK
jgi:hypothetical protein